MTFTTDATDPLATPPPSERVRVRRLPERGRYEREVIDEVLDQALICHVGFVVDGQPFVIPTIHARDGDTIYLHGSPASRMLRTLGTGAPVCVTVTLVDGLVLARSAFHSSMNYRSVVLLGTARVVTDAEEKARAFDVLVEHVAPGRTAELRPPTEDEMRKTLVLAIAIHEASAKVRTGPPKDEPEDYALPIWAGVLPLSTVPEDPVPDPDMTEDLPVPPSVRSYARPGA
jgi:nitroimidazol reductase NimA-like FMN-containing flavoprotein (pyridoxamine 5'-phosphate oxidase superfamily)